MRMHTLTVCWSLGRNRMLVDVVRYRRKQWYRLVEVFIKLERGLHSHLLPAFLGGIPLSRRHVRSRTLLETDT